MVNKEIYDCIDLNAIIIYASGSFYISLYDSTSPSIRQGAVVISSLLVSHGEAQQFSDGRGHGTKRSGESDPKNGIRSTLKAPPGPNEWSATCRSLIHRFFFETPNTLTEGCKWRFFVRACVFSAAPLNKSTRTLCGGKLYYTIIHMFMWLFFCFISVGWADLHSTSAPKRIHALCVCFTQLLWLVDWFFFSHPAHPSNFGPRPFKASRKSQGRI